ncbi:MAG: hypothetical protein P4K97_00270 [Terracidiphilus sp.]|nr:hypothetical protein [Terracidiphilus sp.]
MSDMHIGYSRETNTSSAGGNREPKLPRRDWILLPVISLLTISLILISSELISRWMFYRTSGMGSCFVYTASGLRAKPNSVCWQKDPESPLVEYRFNGSGHRTGMELSPKATGTFRIVMVGSSSAFGQMVETDKTTAAVLPRNLSQQTGRLIELYNESLDAEGPHVIPQRFNEVMAAKPDIILWMFTPYDIQIGTWPAPNPEQQKIDSRNLLANVLYRAQSALASKSISAIVADLFGYSRTALLLRHFLYQSQSQYVSSFLRGGEDADFLRSESNAEWLSKMQQFSKDEAEVEEQAKTAGVPLVTVLLPSRVQAAMISMGEWPEGYDPYKLSGELHKIIESHDGIFIDIFPWVRSTPNSETLFYPVDGHPNAQGHAVFSYIIAKELTSGAVPALSVDAPQHIAQKRGK